MATDSDSKNVTYEKELSYQMAPDKTALSWHIS